MDGSSGQINPETAPLYRDYNSQKQTLASQWHTTSALLAIVTLPLQQIERLMK
jgi:hypothetical protein